MSEQAITEYFILDKLLIVLVRTHMWKLRKNEAEKEKDKLN